MEVGICTEYFILKRTLAHCCPNVCRNSPRPPDRRPVCSRRRCRPNQCPRCSTGWARCVPPAPRIHANEELQQRKKTKQSQNITFHNIQINHFQKIIFSNNNSVQKQHLERRFTTHHQSIGRRRPTAWPPRCAFRTSRRCVRFAT